MGTRFVYRHFSRVINHPDGLSNLRKFFSIIRITNYPEFIGYDPVKAAFFKWFCIFSGPDLVRAEIFVILGNPGERIFGTVF